MDGRSAGHGVRLARWSAIRWPPQPRQGPHGSPGRPMECGCWLVTGNRAGHQRLYLLPPRCNSHSRWTPVDVSRPNARRDSGLLRGDPAGFGRRSSPGGLRSCAAWTRRMADCRLSCERIGLGHGPRPHLGPLVHCGPRLRPNPIVMASIRWHMGRHHKPQYRRSGRTRCRSCRRPGPLSWHLDGTARNRRRLGGAVLEPGGRAPAARPR